MLSKRPDLPFLLSAASAALLLVMPSLRRSCKSRARRIVVPNGRPFGERRSSEEPLSLELQRAQEHDRGRHATQPLQFPERAGTTSFGAPIRKCSRTGSSIAGGVSFFVLLAIFPAITALVSAYGLFFNPARIANDIGQLRDLVPANVLTIVHEQATRLSVHPSRRSRRFSFLVRLFQNAIYSAASFGGARCSALR
jgi:membrane protein